MDSFNQDKIVDQFQWMTSQIVEQAKRVADHLCEQHESARIAELEGREISEDQLEQEFLTWWVNESGWAAENEHAGLAEGALARAAFKAGAALREVE